MLRYRQIESESSDNHDYLLLRSYVWYPSLRLYTRLDQVHVFDANEGNGRELCKAKNQQKRMNLRRLN